MTRQRILDLRHITNLNAVGIRCFGRLDSGVFEQLCKFQSLRKLSLAASYPPTQEYVHIIKLTNLEVLTIGDTNFGDQQFRLLADLPSLKSLVVYARTVKYERVAADYEAFDKLFSLSDGKLVSR